MTPGLATIGVDVGTSSCKAVLVDERGRVVHSTDAGYPTRTGIDGEATQDPRDWLRAVERTLAGCAARASELSMRVVALGVTAPAHVGVLIGDRGQPLSRPMLAWDGRAAAIAPTLRERLGLSYQERTFVRISAAWTVTHLAWLGMADPLLLSRTRLLLTQKDYVRYALTGVAAAEPTDATGSGLFDPRAGVWLEDVAAAVGLAPSALPDVLPSVAVGGTLSAAWARRTGLPKHIPVAVGATDTAAELVALGAVTAGRSIVKIASTGTVVMVSDRVHVDQWVMTYPHAVDGHWYTVAATSSAATAFRWLGELLSADQHEDLSARYRRLDQAAARVDPGAGGVLFLPFLQGERTPYWDPDLRAGFLGLSSAHGRGHLARSVLEGVCLSLRECREVIEDSGLPVTLPAFAGGGAASRLWRTILASVLDAPGAWFPERGPALGAARIASAAIGASSLAATSMGPGRRVVPVRSWVARYDQLYRIYKDSVSAVADVDHRLAAFANARTVRVSQGP